MSEERCCWCGHIQFKPEQVLERVSVQHNIPVKMITGRSRVAAVVEARDCVIAQLWEHGMMLKEIGLWVGGRDHSTVIHALRKAGYKNRLDRHNVGAEVI